MNFPLRGTVAAIGVGETPYYRRGASPEPVLKLTLRAIVAACEDAGISPKSIDGFSSYAHDPNEGPLLMGSLGIPEIRWSSMIAGGGGGGLPAAIGAAAAAIVSGQAETIVVYRGYAERDAGRLNDVMRKLLQGFPHYFPHGVTATIPVGAMRTRRMVEVGGVPASTFQAFVRAEYFHAQQNPRALAFGKPLSDADYLASRMISDPLRLVDNSRENDAAAAIILTSAARARDLPKPPVYLLGCAQGTSNGEIWETDKDYHTAGMRDVADRLWRQSGMSPSDVDVAQIYENFSGPAVASMIDHGLCTAESAGEFLTFENLTAPRGKLPINTSGGLIAEGNVHGMGLALEAVRQLRGESTNPVPDAKVCLLAGGPIATYVSSALFGTAAAL